MYWHSNSSVGLKYGRVEVRCYSTAAGSSAAKNLSSAAKVKKSGPNGDVQSRKILLDTLGGVNDPERTFWIDRDVDVKREFPDIEQVEDLRKKKIRRSNDRISPKRPGKLLGSTKRGAVGGGSGEDRFLEWASVRIPLEDLNLTRTIDARDERCKSFEEVGFLPQSIEAMKRGFDIVSPTMIQQLVYREFMAWRNLLIADRTGTGKTLAYLVPMVEVLLCLERERGYRRRGQRFRAVIVQPNRELVDQCGFVLNRLKCFDRRLEHWKVHQMSGGTSSVNRERQGLNDGVDVLISTPDRVMMHLEQKHVYLDDVKVVVFDEADSLMSESKSREMVLQFVKILKEATVQKTTATRPLQFAFVSATVSPPLMDWLKTEFKNDMTSVIGSVHCNSPDLKQNFLFGARGDFKMRLLFSTLKKHAGKRTIIFCNSHSTAKGIATTLKKAGYSALALTSNLPPKIRKLNFEKFSQDQVRLLVTTDLASRGVDIAVPVKHVILFDFPINAIDYLHRIGRTARAGKGGLVTAFLSKKDHALASSIKEAVLSKKPLSLIRPTTPTKNFPPSSRRKKETSP